MIRLWIGLALLAASWLWGVPYFAPASAPLCAVAMIAGAVCLAGIPLRLPGRRDMVVSLLLLVPVVWFLQWPERVVPLLLVAGLALELLPAAERWARPLGRGAVGAGLVMLVERLALEGYAAQTSRSHDVPWPLAWLLRGVAGLLGLDAALDGNTLALYTPREVLRLGATWELLLDPATLGFFVGGAVLVGLIASSRARGERWAAWIKALRVLGIVVLVWLPVRAGLMMALLVHRQLLAQPEYPMNLMGQFFSTWVHLLLLLGPALAVWWCLRPILLRREAVAEEAAQEDSAPHCRIAWHYPASLGLVALSAAMLALGFAWDPVGSPKQGRVMVVERHSTWEPTGRPYNTTDYGEDACYTYAAIYDYLSRFYAMSRLAESDRIDAKKLSACDVLVIKTPTAPYSPEEVQAVAEFVRGGGGLLLVGEHTNFYKTTSHLNDIARPFGFQYRYDLLFCVGNPYLQPYRPPVVAHPIVQHMPPMNFAVSCSIDPGRSGGRAVIRGTGLWSLPPDYHTENYFPNAEHRPEMRYGAFVQLWSTRYGSGRVLGFTDSTIFSSFCTFEPGKAELLLGMIDWLNRRSPLDGAWLGGTLWLCWVAAAMAASSAGLFLIRARPTPWLSVLAAVMFGWIVGLGATVLANRAAMPPPKPVRPMVRVAIDRTVSDVPLSENGFTKEGGLGYGLAQQWIARLGYFPAFRSGEEAFSGDVLVVICPTRSVPDDYRTALVEYVRSGGKLLVFDSPDVVGSTANSLLWPFGLSSNHNTRAEGELRASGPWPGIRVAAVCEIQGGQPLLWVGRTPVAARTRFGKGTVMAVGFGSVFNDQQMGMNWTTIPKPDTLTHFELYFALLRGLVEERPVAPAVRKEG